MIQVGWAVRGLSHRSWARLPRVAMGLVLMFASVVLGFGAPSGIAATALTTYDSFPYAYGGTSSSVRDVSALMASPSVPAAHVEPAEAGSAQSGQASSVSVAAETETSLYRGVATHHPGYEDAVQGVARPRGGPASALEHNLGDTRSEFTSWTTDPEVARGFAGNGVVLRVPMSSVRGQVVRSPDYFGESEVLLRGPVHGGEVLW